MTDKMAAFISAVSLHGALVLGGGALFVQPAEFGVEVGTGGIEVNLIAAPVVEEQSAQEIPTTEMAVTREPDVIVLSEELSEKKTVLEASADKGDGSSPVPGRDATTLFSGGGAVSNTKPGYLRNPAPRYPEKARKLEQEGVVVLWAYVSASGAPTQVQIKQSSNYPLLDEAALKAVRRWHFEPARLGSLAMDSTVEIPVRFKLND